MCLQKSMIKFLDLQKITAKYSDEIHEAVSRVVDSGWYLQGEENERFEQHYAEYIGTKHCVGCANGLDALIWIYRAYIELGVMQPGDEVIVPANTFIASILAITENGLKPVFVEPRLDTLEIDDSKIEAAITERTRSILLVHLYGRCAYTEKIGEICQKHGLKLVEDNAQAHGCKAQLSTLNSSAQAPSATLQATRSIRARTSVHWAMEVPSPPTTTDWPKPSAPSPTTAHRRSTCSNTRVATADWTRFKPPCWT